MIRKKKFLISEALFVMTLEQNTFIKFKKYIYLKSNHFKKV